MEQEVIHSLNGVDSLGMANIEDASVITMVADSVAHNEISTIEMFGEQSVPVEVVRSISEVSTLTSDPFFQIMTMAALVAVVFFIARHRHQIVAMFGRMLKGRLSEDFSAGRRDEVMTRSFLHVSYVIGASFVVLFAVKYAQYWLPERFVPTGQWLSIAATLYAFAGMALIVVYEHLMLWAIGKITNNQEVTGALLYMKRTGFSLAAIALAPILLFGLLSSQSITGVWNIALIVGCAVLVFLYIKETLVFFIDKKIPIFHWILYLCTVEAFPLSLLWALTMRS